MTFGVLPVPACDRWLSTEQRLTLEDGATGRTPETSTKSEVRGALLSF